MAKQSNQVSLVEKISHTVQNLFNQFLTITMGVYDICGRGARIGLNAYSEKGIRHGVVHVQRPGDLSKNVTLIPFVVDHPNNLVNPNFLTMESLFRQLVKMGFAPKHLEIEVGNVRRVYIPGRISPVFSEAS